MNNPESRRERMKDENDQSCYPKGEIRLRVSVLRGLRKD